MTDEQWEQLMPFAEADATARAAWRAAWLANTPEDARKRLEADIRFQRIKIEMQEAAKALACARRRILGE